MDLQSLASNSVPFEPSSQSRRDGRGTSDDKGAARISFRHMRETRDTRTPAELYLMVTFAAVQRANARIRYRWLATGVKRGLNDSINEGARR